MENTQPTPIHRLKPYPKAEKIKIRICVIWTSTIPGTVKKYTALNCILVDQMVRNYGFIILIKAGNTNN
ncbi:hypothetical protein C1H46_020639 [Malus baccata]|uniref:Uncharacterized protein n=1 Tax=Malus baccata TaxID=106549 RepID=A0A540M4R3_MALBA|nr:hypothetical protein C1H46_020639 [Malus baccata]